MLKEIQFTIAQDEYGKIIHINDAEKGKKYFCPDCNNEFILRKSGKTGKGSRRAHFAHNELTTNCTPESVLHKLFKVKTFDLLNKYKSEGKKLIVNWTCGKCSMDYSKIPIENRNLLGKTDAIKLEYDLQTCRPDIALLDNKEKVIAAIEIVVTHKPDENALNYYKENGITLLQINVSKDEDLFKVEEKLKNPDLVNFCAVPECPNFEYHSVIRKIEYGFIPCRKCGGRSKIYRVIADSVFGKMITDILSEDEIRSIKENGVELRIENHKKTGQKQLVVYCSSCVQIYKSKSNRNRQF